MNDVDVGMTILRNCPEDCVKRFTCHKGQPLPYNKSVCYLSPEKAKEMEGWFFVDYGHTRVARRSTHFFKEGERSCLCGKYSRYDISGIPKYPDARDLQCRACQRKKESKKPRREKGMPVKFECLECGNKGLEQGIATKRYVRCVKCGYRAYF